MLITPWPRLQGGIAVVAGAEIEHDPDPLADLIEQWEDRYWQGEDLAASLCTHAVPDLRGGL